MEIVHLEALDANGPVLGLTAGIVAFADAIPAEHELGLVAIGNTPVVRQEPSTDRTALKQIAKALTAGGTTVLVGALYEMYGRFLRDAGDRWPVLVIITTDGSEGSGQFYPEKFAELGRHMQANDVAAHAIVLISLTKLAAFAQDIVADYDRVSAQYRLEYAGASATPSPDLKVTLLKDGIQMRMSRSGRIR